MSTATQTAARGDYNDRVRRCFADPGHGGDLPDTPGRAVRAFAAEGGAGARIELAALVDDGRIVRLRFRVFGCPHLIAAAELLCARFEGLPVAELGPFPGEELADSLGFPVEKTGRLLCLEDAYDRLRQNCAATA